MSEQEPQRLAADKVPKPGLSAEVQDILRPYGAQLKVKKGHVLHSTGDRIDALYMVDKGACSFSRLNEEGNVEIYGYVRAGNTFAMASPLLRRPATFFFEAIEESVITRVSESTLWKLIDTHAQVRREVILSLARDLMMSVDFAHEFRTLSLAQILARFLVRNADETGMLHLSQEEIANNLGASRFAIGNHLQTFKELELIAIQYGRINVIDPVGLANLGSRC